MSQEQRTRGVSTVHQPCKWQQQQQQQEYMKLML
jgi:hypothetical protein